MKKILSVALLLLLIIGCATEKWESLRSKTEEALNKRDYQQALAYLETAVAQEPKNAEVHYYLGQTYRQMLFNDGSLINNVNIPYALKASKEFHKAIEISPKYTGKKFVVDPYSKIQSNWGALAMTYLYHNKTDSAKWAFAQGLSNGGYYPAILEYNKNIMASCDQNAILFTNGDNDTFPMWFLQLMKNYRTDITVVNLSLLNVPWYIKQLKNSYPFGKNNLFMKLSDAVIDSLRPVHWKEKIVEVPVTRHPQNKDGKISWTVKPTIENKALRVQDLMIIELLKSNDWTRPVYFSTTVYDGNKIGLNKYLTLEGLVYKFSSHKEEKSLDQLSKNLFSNYTYDGMNDRHIEYGDDIKNLYQNYRYTFYNLASIYNENGEKIKAQETLDFMNQELPEKQLPYLDKDLKEKIVALQNKLE